MRPDLARLLQLLFLFFYIDCSYAVSQERVRLIVSEVQHAAQRSDDMQFGDGCTRSHDGFPNFQRAKPRTFCALGLGRDPIGEIQSALSGRSFFPQIISFNSLYRTQKVPTRAPPSAQ
jgi:hypothetical protein